MKIVRWAPLARADLETIVDYHRPIDAALAIGLNDSVLLAVDFLSEYPMAGAAIEGGERRKWRVSRLPYLVFYRPTDRTIDILRVLHVAQDQSSAF